MTANASNLIWIDLEMTGLDPEQDRIIEIATLVTDAETLVINVVAAPTAEDLDAEGAGEEEAASGEAAAEGEAAEEAAAESE